jgi:UDP-N-acetylenolpyruvoylglucosamine reductase
MAFAEKVIAAVEERFAVTLEPEPTRPRP